MHSPSTDIQKCVGRLAPHRAASTKVGHTHRHDLVGESRAGASLVDRALTLHVLREKLPDITEVTWLMGTQWFLMIKGVHVTMCPSDSKVTKMISTTGSRHDLDSVDPVLEDPGISACPEL